MRRLPVVLLTATMLAAWSASALAQGLGFAKPPSVTVAPIAAVAVSPGKSAKVEIALRVDPGFHINSHEPRDKYLVPTAVRLDPPTNLVIRGVTYPPGQDQTFDFMPGETLNVYAGDVLITAMVYAPGAASRGTFRVHGALKYQACDNRQCYPPKEVPVQFDVKVQPATVHHNHRNPAQSPNVR
jgi:hypothetical protein